ncbi:magnesium transporter NIPA-domain-containing protein [Fomes fomentarius]|nr:magnesium transporter NIPA-domain-containing protein [Fomes fomentarius]
MHVRIPHIAGLEDIPDGIDLPQISPSTAAGIGVAIAGNILISLALNCQKLAHRRLEREREAAAQAPRPLEPNSRVRDVDDPLFRHQYALPATNLPTLHSETVPLLEPGHVAVGAGEPPKPGRRWFFFRRTPYRYHAHDIDSGHLASTHALMPVEVVPASSGSSVLSHSNGEQKPHSKDGSESDYLKSKLWWLGFLLMNVGEMGNFISYAFAPASVVAPLGTFALIANCIFAPVILKERFRKRDFIGIALAVLGAVTVVLSANPSDTRLNPDGLIKAITQRPFEIYALTYVVGIVLLSGLSERSAGKRWVYVDVGLCALFGGFTVLSTKAVSTLLTMEWFQIFKEWITYPVIAIVVPTQFVMFNLSAIVGSALLYGDFKKATFHQLLNFLYGCGATFAGVFIIAWAPSSPRPTDEDEDEDDTIHTATLPGSPGDPTSSGAATLSEDSAVPSSMRTAKVGSFARRNRAMLVIPDGATSANSSPSLRNRHSVVSLYGFSPAQRVLLISSSPRDEFIRPNLQDRDPERDVGDSPGSFGRRRAVNWLDDIGDNNPTSRQVRRYGATSTPETSREQSRTGDRVPATTRSGSGSRSRSRSVSLDPFT